MQTISKEQLIKRFQVLPEVLQDAVFSDRTADAIGKACQLRDVNEDLLSLIATLTGRVLLGYLQPESFAFEIQKETGIDALKATQVAHDIDAEIFSEVRLELKKLYPPTIQTPTVQAQGFIRSQPIATEPPKPAPRYVVQIPERFKKTAPPSQISAENLGGQVALSSQKTNEASSVSTPTPITEQKPAAPAPSPAKTSAENLGEQVTAQKPAVPSQSAPQAPEAVKAKEAGVPMDPVVPLPTFIQSKFKQGLPDQSKKENAPSAPPANDALKNAFGKFTVSSTATEVKKEPVSPYRETIEEPKKAAEPLRQAQDKQKPIPKTQGKVIDLSQF